MKYRSISLILLPLLIFGCEKIQLGQEISVKKPTLVIAPTTKLQISNTETAHVIGYDKCPEQSENMFMGEPSMKLLLNGCINLGKEAQEVRVTWRVNGIDFIEVWKVDRQGGAVSFIRPNGFQVREPFKQ